MSQKKHKKRHPQKKHSVSAPAMESEFASDGRRKRMNRTSRNILLFTLVMLAAVQLLTPAGLMTVELANGLSLLALVLLIIALWLQFRNPSGGSSGSGWPQLR